MEYAKADARRLELIAREAGKAGLRGRINAKCIECLYGPIQGFGNWKQQITACTDASCPLYEVRPISKPEKKKRPSAPLKL